MSSTPSYVSGTGSLPLVGQTIGDFLSDAAERWPDREAVVVRHQRIRWTFSELNRRAAEFGAGLLAVGLQPGDRIGIWAPNCSEWIVAQYGTAKAGLILVNVNPAYRTAELQHALRKSGCKALITAPRLRSTDYIAMLRELAPELDDCPPGALCSLRFPDLRLVICTGPDTPAGMAAFDSIAGPPASLPTNLQFDDPINIQFTSGTTGLPKGATLTHHNILNNGYFVARRMGLRECDRLCVPVPLYHCFGMVMSSLSCVTQGATMVFPSESFDAHAVLETIEQERCTAVHGVPTMFVAEIEHPDFARFDLTSLRCGIMAGSPCPIELMRKVVDRMHMREITIAYGMTETSPVSFQSSTDDPLERRVTTVGTVHEHVEVKIVDDEGRVVPRGVPGELLTRGYSIMRGYWDDEEQTANAIDDAGWMHTGDIATIDEQGYCNIVGRLKDMVLRGGENIYPREVEEFLYQMEQIETVQVFGVPDHKYGEEVCAWIRLRRDQTLTADEVRAFCRSRIARFKIPRYIEFVDDFPITVTGKFQKFVMRERMAAKLGLIADETA